MDNSQRLKELATQPIGRLLWKYSIPGVVGMLVQALYNVVDRIFIGQWSGPEAIAGLTVTFPLMSLATAIGVLIGIGSCSRVSILLGAGDKKQAEHILGNALTLTLVNGFAYIAVFALVMDQLLMVFGADETTLPLAREYMVILLPGMILTNIAYSLNNVMRASGYPGRAMVTMIIGGIVNVALDPLFIKVLGMGIAGAAIATDIAMFVSAWFVLAHFCRKDSTLRFRRGTFGLNWQIFVTIVSIGAAPAVINAASCGINAIVNRSLIAYASEGTAVLDIAAAGIFTTFNSLSIIIVLGICQGLQPIIGYNYGSGNSQRLWHSYWLAVGVSTLLTTASSVIGVCCPQIVALCFNGDEHLIETTSYALRNATWAFSVVGFQVVSTTFFQSIGKAGKSIFLSLSRQVIFLVPLLLILPNFMEVKGVWMSFPISDLMATVVTVVLIGGQYRIMKRHQSQSNPIAAN